MHDSKVLQRIRGQQVAFGVTLHLRDTMLFEMTAGLGFDAIWLDLEHHNDGEPHATELIRAARAGGQTDVVVRPAQGEFGHMARLLEAGAHGVMYPGCSSVDEAREVVRWAKFPPVGRRGFDGSNVDSGYMAYPMTEYLERASTNTFIIIQIEDPSSLPLVDDIARVEGVDRLMLGPADMSVRMGLAGQFDHPEVVGAQRRVAQAAKSAGKQWATTTMSMEQLRQFREQGAGLIFHGADLVMVRQALLDLSGKLNELH
ncbi:MAG: HpcH/HpaI aldolase family protein [Aeoliella sp.]